MRLNGSAADYLKRYVCKKQLQQCMQERAGSSLFHRNV